jgi:hypothetical protein
LSGRQRYDARSRSLIEQLPPEFGFSFEPIHFALNPGKLGHNVI